MQTVLLQKGYTVTKRRKVVRPVAAFDLDGTLFREQLIVLLMDEFLQRGIFDSSLKDEFEELCLNHRYRHITYDEYDNNLVRMFLSGIQGTSAKKIAVASKEIAKRHKNWVYTFTRTLLEFHQSTHECITITGANDHVVKHLAKYWGFSHFYSTELEISQGRYTGHERKLPVRDKALALRDHVLLGTSMFTGSMAVGDTASDIAMLVEVDHPIAFNPSAELADRAEKEHWPIVVERKDAIYVICCGNTKRFSMQNAEDAVHHVISLRKCK